jgi:Flp pilus assembly protein TadG
MHLPRSLPRRRIARFVARRGFARNESGATAVEFGLLALPFFTIIFAILETSLVFFAGQILDAAVHDASRKIRTGQAQTAPAWDLAAFRSAVCEGLYTMFDCTSGDTGRLRVKVSVVSTFASATIANPIGEDCEAGGDEEDCDWTIVESFDPGVGSQVIMVQAFYKWPTVLNLPGFNLATQAGDNRLLSAVRVFSNEPF